MDAAALRRLERAAQVVAAFALFVSSTHLLMRSTFRMRLRDDVPTLLPGVPGVEGIVIALALLLAAAPLLARRRYLPVFLVSSFVAMGAGSYWWTTVPWDELITESDFATTAPPGLLDFLVVASPLLVFAAAWAVIAPLRQAADQVERGADTDEAAGTRRASTVAGALLALAALLAPAAVWLAHRLLWSGGVGGLLPGGVRSVGVALLVLGAGGWIALRPDERPRDVGGAREGGRGLDAEHPKR